MPRRDPIIEELQEVREEMARACAYDVARLCEVLRAHQVNNGRKMVTLKPRRVAKPPKVS